MARTAIPIQEIPRNGGVLDDIAWTAGDATNDHEFANTGNELLLMKNTHSSEQTATVVSVADEYGRTGDGTLAPDATTGISIAGPFKPPLWNSAAGLMYVDLTDDTGVTFAVVRFVKG